MKNRKGFTLAELLAVVVILALLLVIAVPKILNIIMDSKKSTFETNAKMIASLAEKKNIENALFGKTGEIECADVVKASDVDYVSCNIEIDSDGIANVTISGGGKFEGLYVCDGTKTNLEVTESECPAKPKAGALYIYNLLEKESTLKKTTARIDGKTVNAGIRYVGSSPNNQVYFNCSDIDKNDVEYGKTTYDYKSSCEVWRIIGVFEVQSKLGGRVESRIKIVRDVFPVNMSWDSSADGSISGEIDVNKGNGINQWGEVDDYSGSDLMQILNGYYIKESDTCIYCNASNQGTCPTSNDCTGSITQLSRVSLNMIDNTVWKLGTTEEQPVISLLDMYNGERNSDVEKNLCSSISSSCNDSVARTKEWVGKVGLIYASDYAYASTDTTCSNDIIGNDSKCDNNNWLKPSGYNYWTISPIARIYSAYYAWYVSDTNNIFHLTTGESNGVRPTLYLSSDVEIIGGNGNDLPYKLGF